MGEANHRKLNFLAPDSPPNLSQEESPPLGVEPSLLISPFLAWPKNTNRPWKMGRILSPQGYPESTFRTLMRILGKGKKDSTEDGRRKSSGSDQGSSNDPARPERPARKAAPNPEARREWDPSCFPSGRKEQRPGQTPNPKNRRDQK